jgi:hypothetical protein
MYLELILFGTPRSQESCRLGAETLHFFSKSKDCGACGEGQHSAADRQLVGGYKPPAHTGLIAAEQALGAAHSHGHIKYIGTKKSAL